VFTAPRERAASRAPRERRIAQLSFIQPPIGAHLSAVEDLYGSGSPEQAFRHSTVWACEDLIASMMGMMQPWAYKVPPIGVATPGAGAPGPPAKLPTQPVILNQPGADMDIGDWLWAGTVALTRGNVYGKTLSRDRLGFPAQIELQDNGKVQVRQQPDGSTEYKYSGQVQDPATVWHRSIFRMAGAVTGLSILQHAQRAVRLGLSAEEFGAGFFDDGAHPSALLTNDSEAEFDQGDAQTVKQKFMAAVHGSREPVVMTGGWKYQQVQVNPHDSQFLDTQGMSDLKVCRFFRVWPEMVSVTMQGQNVTYSNVEQRALDFLTYTMQRWITWWERKLGAMTPAGQYVKFDLSPLLRTDIYTRWRTNHAMLGTRAVAPSEIRQMEDMPPLTDAQRQEIAAVAALAPMPALHQGLSSSLRDLREKLGRPEVFLEDLAQLEG